MRGRPSKYNNKEVEAKAQQLFWSKGYTATSMDDLLKAMGIGYGSFYNAYKGGKKELFRKAIQQRREAFDAFKKELAQSEAPLGLIKDFFRSIAAADETSHLQGCIIVNTVVEMTFIDDELEKEAVQILKEVEQMFIDTIANEQKKGRLKNQTNPEVLGRYLITFWNGLNVTRRMHPDKGLLQKQIEMQLEVIS